MNKTVSDLRKILGRVAKDGKQIVKSQMEECIIALSDAVCASDKRLGLKIVGKPCEGKPHVRFDEGPLGRLFSRTSGLLYSILLLYELNLRNSKNIYRREYIRSLLKFSLK
jgi:hypothetical protein